MEFGYALSSEEHGPSELVRQARLAEESGFKFAMISDHFHPWVDEQGESPFVWSVLGGIAHATEELAVGTAVTCPIMRFHPALVAQATSTVAAMMPGRFFLGVGTGEYLNEHIFGEAWPPPDIRQERLVEAIRIIRELWQGKEYSYRGKYFTVQHARIYTLPEETPPIYMAAAGEESARLAGEIADGIISTASGNTILKEFQKNGGKGKPCIGQIKVCWANSNEEAQETMRHWWPVSAVSGLLHADLPTPKHFEDVIDAMGEPKLPKDSPLGPEPDAYLEAVRVLEQNGFDHIYIHQVGPDQEGFLRFFKHELLPLLEKESLVKETL